MKKLLLLSSVLTVITLSSCKKEYMCTCTSSASGQSWDNVYMDAMSITEAETKRAECEANTGCKFEESRYPY